MFIIFHLIFLFLLLDCSKEPIFATRIFYKLQSIHYYLNINLLIQIVLIIITWQYRHELFEYMKKSIYNTSLFIKEGHNKNIYIRISLF